MSKINILDEHLANMIAAGEVVERPMGVVKELVENSIDASSSKITIKVYNGGLDGIEVIDDGCGMDKKDAVKAFERHATSKISQQEDLWKIHTMGFRGEALPSIAAVSKVTLKSSDGNDSTIVQIEFGKIMKAGPVAYDKGTSVKVTELFYKTPARLKHMKSGMVEFNQILELIQKMALSHPEIAFELYSDDKIRLSTNGSNSLQEVLLAIYGLEVARKAIPVSFKDYDFDINGYIVLPSITRSSKNYINTYINGRVIRSFLLQKAVIEGYHGFMMPDRYPIVVLNINIDYQLVDVNVHPSKWEIRISKERNLYSLITTSIAQAIIDHNRVGDITMKPVEDDNDFDNDQCLNIETITNEFENKSIVAETKIIEEKNEKIFDHPNINYSQPIVTKEKIVQQSIDDYTDSQTQLERFTYLAQLHGRYILAYDEENLYVIDQHAAQERCMYEKIQNEILDAKIQVQPLLIPLIIEVTPAQLSRLDEINEVLKCIHLQLEPFSANSVVTHEVPIFFEEINETEFIHDLIESIMDDKKMTLLDIAKDKIATLACHSSVKFNQYLSIEESKKLLSRLSNCAQPFNCPHGRPTMMAISEKQLQKEFKRV